MLVDLFPKLSLKIQFSNLNLVWNLNKSGDNIRKMIKSNFDFGKITNIVRHPKMKSMALSMRRRDYHPLLQFKLQGDRPNTFDQLNWTLVFISDNT